MAAASLVASAVAPARAAGLTSRRANAVAPSLAPVRARRARSTTVEGASPAPRRPPHPHRKPFQTSALPERAPPRSPPDPARPVILPPIAVAAAAAEKPWKKSNCRLVLEDGSVWNGQSFGATGTVLGEVVFNTSLTGYQEILTDPSYAGQFVLFTCPEIGNVGINLEDMESTKAHMGGMLVRHLSLNVSNYRSAMSLPEYLEQQGVIGISDIDTRAITRRLRDTGCLNGVITTDNSKTDDELVKMCKEWTIVGKDMIGTVTSEKAYEWKDPTGEEWEWAAEAKASSPGTYNVVCYDFGIKHNIMRRLASFGCKLTVVPADTPASEVDGDEPRRHPLQQRTGRSLRSALRRGEREGDPRPGARVRHLHGTPGARPGFRRGDLQAQVWPPRRQPPGSGPHRPSGDLVAEPQLRGGPRELARGGGGEPHQPQRRDVRRHGVSVQARDDHSVSPGGAGPPRQRPVLRDPLAG